MIAHRSAIGARRVALHAELPSVQPAQTMLEIATSQKWHDIVELMTPLVSVRLASLPVALWTPTDTLNFVLAQVLTFLPKLHSFMIFCFWPVLVLVRTFTTITSLITLLSARVDFVSPHKLKSIEPRTPRS